MKPLPTLIVSALLSTLCLQARQTPPVVNPAPRIEVCFVLDTTGSMGGLIQGAKEKIWSIVQEMKDANPVPELKIGLIGYRDRGDEYVTRIYEMTDDLDALYGELLQYQADGGGDTPESVNQALNESLTKIEWSKETSVYRVVFLVGDAPPQTKYKEPQIPELCTLANQKDIVINTVQCGSIHGTREIWKDIATRTGGDYAAIKQDGGTQVIATPYDEDIQAYNLKINQTVIVYGDARRQEVGASKLRHASADSSASVSRAAWNAKYNEGKAISGGEDLLAEVQAKDDFDYSKVKAAHLPEALRDLSPDELRAHVQKKQAEREQALKKMRALVEKRDAFLKAALEEKRAEGELNDAFDEQIRKSIRKQGSEKGIEY